MSVQEEMFITLLHHSVGFFKLVIKMKIFPIPINGMEYTFALINQTFKNYLMIFILV
jgi:hypothetical protein